MYNIFSFTQPLTAFWSLGEIQALGHFFLTVLLRIYTLILFAAGRHGFIGVRSAWPAMAYRWGIHAILRGRRYHGDGRVVGWDGVRSLIGLGTLCFSDLLRVGFRAILGIVGVHAII